MTLPLAGQIIRASDVWRPRFIQKTASIVYTSNATPTNDPEIQIPLTVGQWRIHLYLYASAAAAGSDVRVNWTFSGTLTTQRSCTGPGQATIDVNPNATTAGSGMSASLARAIGTNQIYGCDGTSTGVIIEDLMLDVSVAGTLVLQHAQGSSSANATTISSGTHCYVTQVEAN